MEALEYTPEDLGRVVKFTLKPKPRAPSKAPEPVPQAPVTPTQDDRDAANRRKYNDQLEGQVEFYFHPEFFSEDSPDISFGNAEKVLAYIAAHGGYVSRATVAEGIRACKAELTPLRREPPPVKPAVAQPVQPAPVAPAVVTPMPPPDPDAGLPPLPEYVIRVLGSNKLRTRKDVRDISSALYSHLYKGPHADAFRARIEAITRR